MVMVMETLIVKMDMPWFPRQLFWGIVFLLCWLLWLWWLKHWQLWRDGFGRVFQTIFLRYSGVPASGQQCTFMAVGKVLWCFLYNILIVINNFKCAIFCQFSYIICSCYHTSFYFNFLFLYLRNSASSFHWQSSSIFSFCLSSRIGNISSSWAQFTVV